MGKQKLKSKKNLKDTNQFWFSNNDVTTRVSCSSTDDSTQSGSECCHNNFSRLNHGLSIQSQDCKCVQPPFNNKATEFFLPERLPCSCCAIEQSPQQDPKVDDDIDQGNIQCSCDVLLEDILRPWQVRFLVDSFSITKVSEFVEMQDNVKAKLLVKAMMIWLKKTDIRKLKNDRSDKKACAVALHIWFKSCRDILKQRNQQETGSLTKSLPDSKLDPFIIKKEVPALSLLLKKETVKNEEVDFHDGCVRSSPGRKGPKVPSYQFLHSHSRSITRNLDSSMASSYVETKSWHEINFDDPLTKKQRNPKPRNSDYNDDEKGGNDDALDCNCNRIYNTEQEENVFEYDDESYQNTYPSMKKKYNSFHRQLDVLEREHYIHEELLYVTDTFEAAFNENGSGHNMDYSNGGNDLLYESSKPNCINNSCRRRSLSSLSSNFRESFRGIVSALQEEQTILGDSMSSSSTSKVRRSSYPAYAA